jgi:hypothetical protein
MNTELDVVANERQTQLKKNETELDKLKSGDLTTTRTLIDESKRVEQLQQQRSTLMRQREEFAAKIRELGAMPSSELAASLAELAPPALLRRLRTCNESLRS